MAILHPSAAQRAFPAWAIRAHRSQGAVEGKLYGSRSRSDHESLAKSTAGFHGPRYRAGNLYSACQTLLPRGADAAARLCRVNGGDPPHVFEDRRHPAVDCALAFFGGGWGARSRHAGLCAARGSVKSEERAADVGKSVMAWASSVLGDLRNWCYFGLTNTSDPFVPPRQLHHYHRLCHRHHRPQFRSSRLVVAQIVSVCGPDDRRTVTATAAITTCPCAAPCHILCGRICFDRLRSNLLDAVISEREMCPARRRVQYRPQQHAARPVHVRWGAPHRRRQ